MMRAKRHRPPYANVVSEPTPPPTATESDDCAELSFPWVAGDIPLTAQFLTPQRVNLACVASVMARGHQAYTPTQDQDLNYSITVSSGQILTVRDRPTAIVRLEDEANHYLGELGIDQHSQPLHPTHQRMIQFQDFHSGEKSTQTDTDNLNIGGEGDLQDQPPEDRPHPSETSHENNVPPTRWEMEPAATHRRFELDRI
jgi:hypothetical protein